MVFTEILRVLKPGGRMVISELVTSEPPPDSVRESTAEWVEGFGGAAVKDDYLEMIETAGFHDVEILEESPASGGTEDWRSSLSNLTVRAYKPAS